MGGRNGEPAKSHCPPPVLVSLTSRHTTPTDCTANATVGGYDCVVGGQTVHVNATANVTQVGREVVLLEVVGCRWLAGRSTLDRRPGDICQPTNLPVCVCVDTTTLQVQAPGTIVWNNASSGDVTVTAPGVSVVRAICMGLLTTAWYAMFVGILTTDWYACIYK